VWHLLERCILRRSRDRRMDARRRFAGVGAACVLVCFFSACGGSPLSLGSPAPPISVSVSPAIAAVQTGSTALLTATVSNDPGYRGVTWTVSCAGLSRHRAEPLQPTLHPPQCPQVQILQSRPRRSPTKRRRVRRLSSRLVTFQATTSAWTTTPMDLTLTKRALSPSTISRKCDKQCRRSSKAWRIAGQRRFRQASGSRKDRVAIVARLRRSPFQ